MVKKHVKNTRSFMKGDDRMKQIILYGITGVEHNYQVVKYFCIFEEDISIWFMRHKAAKMKEDYPVIKHVYAVDNRPGLRRDFLETLKNPTIEGCVAFKDFLEREGLLIA